MNLEITRIGLLIASPFYLLCAGLLWFGWRRMKTKRWRYALLLLLPVIAALPFADEFRIAWQFEQACKEAGVKVYRTVEVEGFYDDVIPSGFELIEHYGYRVMEHRSNMDNSIEKVLKVNNRWIRESLNKPTARYHYRYADPRQWVPVGWKVSRHEMQIVDSVTGEILGREVSAERQQNFIEQLWMRFVGSGIIYCNRPLDDKQKSTPTGALYSYVLIPKKPN